MVATRHIFLDSSFATTCYGNWQGKKAGPSSLVLFHNLNYDRRRVLLEHEKGATRVLTKLSLFRRHEVE